MAGLSVIFGILLIILMLRKSKPLSGRGLTMWLIGIALFYAGTTALIANRVTEPERVAYVAGRAVGAYVLLLLLVALGYVIRNRRAKS